MIHSINNRQKCVIHFLPSFLHSLSQTIQKDTNISPRFHSTHLNNNSLDDPFNFVAHTFHRFFLVAIWFRFRYKKTLTLKWDDEIKKKVVGRKSALRVQLFCAAYRVSCALEEQKKYFLFAIEIQLCEILFLPCAICLWGVSDWGTWTFWSLPDRFFVPFAAAKVVCFSVVVVAASQIRGKRLSVRLWCGNLMQ